MAEAMGDDDDGPAPFRLAQNFDMILLYCLGKQETQVESVPLWVFSAAGRKALYSSKREKLVTGGCETDSTLGESTTPDQTRLSRGSSAEDLGFATEVLVSQSTTPETVGSSTFSNATKYSGTPKIAVTDEGLSGYATSDHNHTPRAYVSHLDAQSPAADGAKLYPSTHVSSPYYAEEINGTTYYRPVVGWLEQAEENFRQQELKLSLLEQLLVHIRCEDLQLLRSPSIASVAQRPVHVFIDLSNIHIGWLNALKVAWRLEQHVHVRQPHFDFYSLHHIFVRGREVAKRVLAGSVSAKATTLPDYMAQAEALGYEMNIFRRVVKEAIPRRSYSSPSDASADERAPRAATKFSEQGVDEILHLKMLQSLVDCGGEPGTIVLATGDAREAQFSDGFKANIVRLLKEGWSLELYAWSRQLSEAWEEKSFMRQWKHQMRVIRLDQFADVLIPQKTGIDPTSKWMP